MTAPGAAVPVVKKRKTYAVELCEISTGARVVSSEIVPGDVIVIAASVTDEASMLSAPAGRLNVTSMKLRSFSVSVPVMPPAFGSASAAVSCWTLKPSVFARLVTPPELKEPAMKPRVTAPGANDPPT